ncbi:hypothetical protein A9K71_21030 [Mesorhizobium sp. WSM3873]|nr:hypothetical protein A9K71_21030 [Mesorhizobium sp. WSM3873]
MSNFVRAGLLILDAGLSERDCQLGLNFWEGSGRISSESRNLRRTDRLHLGDCVMDPGPPMA